MKQKTIIRRQQQSLTDFPDSVHPVLQRVYAGRALNSASELDYSLQRLLPYTLLGNIEQAAALLVEAIVAGKRIVIVADYDADGATACALAIRGLRSMGAKDVQYVVPDRFAHGYGLSPDVVELTTALKPDLLLTVDNGISSVEGVALARSRACDVLITDHHLPGPVLPSANVIVNPNLANDGFPSKALAGVGVMFYVLAALRVALREADWFATEGLNEPNLAQFLDLVALGTVADVVPLDFNNRILVAQGLQRIQAGRCVQGISALLTVAKRLPAQVVSSDLGFAVGPRLNAAGRLEDMSLGIECLLCDEATAALQMATRLDALNQERREIQADMEVEALNIIRQVEAQADAFLAFGLCFYQPHWHQGVIGILASKMKDKTHRPVIAFARDNDGVLKGSARSIRDIHIRDVIEAIATANPDLILKYGGHAMAAGLSIREQDYELFTGLFDSEIEAHINVSGFDSTLISDGELRGDEMSVELAEQFRQAGPWGQGFPEPQFDGQFTLLNTRIVADKHLKLQLSTGTQGHAVEAIAFNTTDASWPAGCKEVQAVYRLDINEYRGRRSAQLIVEHIEPLPQSEPH